VLAPDSSVMTTLPVPTGGATSFQCSERVAFIPHGVPTIDATSSSGTSRYVTVVVAGLRSKQSVPMWTDTSKNRSEASPTVNA
jgi:hypothetical protein